MVCSALAVELSVKMLHMDQRMAMALKGVVVAVAVATVAVQEILKESFVDVGHHVLGEDRGLGEGP